MSDDKSLNEGRFSRKYPSMRDVFDWNCPSMRDFFSQYWRPWQCLYREGRHRNGFRQYHSAVMLRVELLSPQLLGNDTFLLPTWVTTGKCHSWGFSDSFEPPQMQGTCRNLNEKMRLRQVSCLKVVVIWCFLYLSDTFNQYENRYEREYYRPGTRDWEAWKLSFRRWKHIV